MQARVRVGERRISVSCTGADGTRALTPALSPHPMKGEGGATRLGSRQPSAVGKHTARRLCFRNASARRTPSPLAESDGARGEGRGEGPEIGLGNSPSSPANNVHRGIVNPAGG